jgi:hypothetical protein
VKLTAVQKHRIRETVSRVRAAKTWKPRLPGGPTTHPKHVSAVALRRGAEIEIEHTKSPRLAIEIALAHLLERSDYYERLKAVEGEGT